MLNELIMNKIGPSSARFSLSIRGRSSNKAITARCSKNGDPENAALMCVQLEFVMQLMVKPFTIEALGSRINAMIVDD
jgi:hypothetical protein